MTKVADTKVADIIVGNTDLIGARIDAVYGKVSGTYAVYRTAERVVVQFADNEKLGTEQRQALAPLNPIKGEINGLVDGWRGSDRNDEKAMARVFDRRVADALVVGLQGDVPHAKELLAAVKSDVSEERTSVARTQYLIVAVITAAVVIAGFSFVTSPWYARALFDFSTEVDALWFAAGVGGLGALFSIALAIRSRVILTDLQWRDNAVDAILRVVIGAISAAILVTLFNSKLVTIGTSTAAALDQNLLIIIAFVAGFSERLVGDLLGQSIASAIKANPLAGGAPPVTDAAKPPTANEQNPLGKPTTMAAASDIALRAQEAERMPAATDVDPEGCAADLEIAAEAQTHDVELPEASGGIEKLVKT